MTLGGEEAVFVTLSMSLREILGSRGGTVEDLKFLCCA
jgi:hypothetical protein